MGYDGAKLQKASVERMKRLCSSKIGQEDSAGSFGGQAKRRGWFGSRELIRGETREKKTAIASVRE